MNKQQEAYIAMNRFGYGASAGDVRDILKTDPIQWLSAQLVPYAMPKNDYTSEIAISEVMAYNQLRNQAREESNSAQENEALLKQRRKDIVSRARDLALESTSFSFKTSQVLQARLLDFFSNHFSVSRNNLLITALAPTMEREAIAANLSGSFEEMLQAVISHPAMLLYLNNEKSIGPNSRVGRRRKGKGLNENLAREILELHTLGVQAGYTQQDVVEFAKALTGWSIGRPNKGEPAGFKYRVSAHEPGNRTVLGKTYQQRTKQDGLRQAQGILRDLASHPSTAQYLSFKLARHFIADQPSPKLVGEMKRAYLASGGNIPAVVTAMLSHPDAWSLKNQKFKTPRDFVISSCRACQLYRPKPNVFQIFELMGQGFFNAGSPAGYADTSDAWSSAQALRDRIEWAGHFAEQVTLPVNEIAQYALGPLLSEKTAKAIERAESQSQAIILLLLSPEFQRR